MSWNQITESWKQFVAIVASLQNSAAEANPERDKSNRADAFRGARYQEAQLPPYVPDNRRERSDSSLHLSC
jgi:hypothetical protein